jgi:hypothetical protein
MIRVRTWLSLAGWFTLSAGLAMAEEPGSDKFAVQGDRLIYDTENAQSSDENEISDDDVDLLLSALQKTPGIKTLELNSQGGSVYGATEMARIVTDFGLDTIVSGECFSSCVTLFLAGESRKMMLGSKIGFHQTRWPPEAIKNYYDNLAEDEGWETPFDFAAWVYEDTQTEVFDDLTYMIARGVDPGFAIRTKGVRNDEKWYPTRLELVQAGVLRD